jgi:hypothetical protein
MSFKPDARSSNSFSFTGPHVHSTSIYLGKFNLCNKVILLFTILNINFKIYFMINLKLLNYLYKKCIGINLKKKSLYVQCKLTPSSVTWVGSVFYLVRQQGMIFTNILSNYVKTCNKLLL